MVLVSVIGHDRDYGRRIQVARDLNPSEIYGSDRQPRLLGAGEHDWFMPSRALTEILSWKVATNLMRQHPTGLRLVETHPGGGTYDCLSLYDREDHQRAAIHLNRAGSATVLGSFDNRGTVNEIRDEWRSIWPETVAIGDLRRVASELAIMSGLASVDKLPPTANEILVFRVIAAFLTATGFASTRWECRMGYADTSGIGGGPRSELFEQFPTLSEASTRHERGDLLGEPLYRFWFILRADVPVVGFETTSGTAETANGATHNVMDLYRASKRRLWPVVSRVAGAFLP